MTFLKRNRSVQSYQLVPSFILFLLAAGVGLAQSGAEPKPTFADVKYGPHERNVLDFWQAKSPQPTPLVVYIHGGGFRGGSKASLNANTLRTLLGGGISVAALNYRFVDQAPLPAAHYDCRRALQFLRFKARDWNIDKTRVGAFGGSAGAQICMYLAFHDEMARPESADPLERESTRLTCVATRGGQTTMDQEWWKQHIPGYESPHRNFLETFGVQTKDAYQQKVAQVSALSLISKDDPPIFMSYGMPPDAPVPGDPQRARGWKVHHVAFGVALKKQMDELGIEAELQYPGAPTRHRSDADFFLAKLGTSESAPMGRWQPFSPREELRPEFTFHPTGGPDGKGGLVIKHDHRKFLDGAWTNTFEVQGDQHYWITAHCRHTKVVNPRPDVYAELLFHDEDGNLVLNQRTGVQSRPFYPPDVSTDAKGWTKYSGIYRAPAAATRATVRLHLRWEPDSEVEWGGISLEASAPRTPRKVRLAAANYRPRGGKTALDNCRQLRPVVAQAAAQKADLVVFGECITAVGNGLSYVEAAEPIPGPCTDYLGSLAKEYRLHLVTSLHEREGHLIYNTAVLLGPGGRLLGKYRKVCLARDEYRKGVAPGRQFPVFETALGQIGMMICFDVHMPEVARGLAANGAEIIALPIMGGHPALARARAIENQIYLVTSTYSVNDDWMQTGVWDLNGELLTRATDKNAVVVAEVDLAQQHFWRANMGDFKGRLRHERPAVALPE